MQRKLFTIVILSLITLSAAPGRLVRLTIINKSGMPAAVQLQGIYDDDLFYYLRVAQGDREYPFIETFTISPDTYSFKIFYIEYYDPVYGFKCGFPSSGQLTATGNIKIVIHPCTPSSAGSAGLLLRLLLIPPRYRY